MKEENHGHQRIYTNAKIVESLFKLNQKRWKMERESNEEFMLRVKEEIMQPTLPEKTKDALNVKEVSDDK